MDIKDLLKEIKIWKRENGFPFKVSKRRGKESHYWVQVGSKGTTVPKRLTRALCKAILRQLDLDRKQD